MARRHFSGGSWDSAIDRGMEALSHYREQVGNNATATYLIADLLAVVEIDRGYPYNDNEAPEDVVKHALAILDRWVNKSVVDFSRAETKRYKAELKKRPLKAGEEA